LNWNALIDDLKGFEYKDFGEGTAMSNVGEQTPLLMAQKDENQWIYLPRHKHLILRGTDPDKSVAHFKQVREKVQAQFNKRKWEKNFRFYEIHVIHEFEPRETTPMDMMRGIAPIKGAEPFIGAFKDKKPVMYAFRFANWEGQLPSNLRESVPWFEITVQPMFENTDRMMSEIVSRDKDLESVESMAERMRAAVFTFMDEHDKGDQH
jgi:hypothetical protein